MTHRCSAACEPPGVCPHCLYPIEYVNRRAYNWDTLGARHSCEFLNGEPITQAMLTLNEREWNAMQSDPPRVVAPSESKPHAAEPVLRVVE